MLDTSKGHGKNRGLHFFLWKGNENQLGTEFSVHHRAVSAATRPEIVSDRVSYRIVPRGRWFNSIVLNVHGTSEEKMMIKKKDFMRN